jgi:acetylornithine deacetylase/succinyl-diaminopimelate desuccinylase-like protein
MKNFMWSVFCVISQLAAAQSQLEIANTLSAYVQVPSETGNEKAAGEYISHLCEEKGLYIRRFTTENGRYNFAASLYPLENKKPNIIFLSHLDVVPAGDKSYWKYPPYSGHIENDTIWGRGSIDNKGQTVAALYAVLDFIDLAKKQDLSYNVSLLCVSGEETDSKGGAELVADDYFMELNPALIIGEGGTGVKDLEISSDKSKKVYTISVAEKSHLGLEVRMKLKSSGHGSVPPPLYASKEMIQGLGKIARKSRRLYFTPSTIAMLKSIGQYEKGIKGFVMRHPRTFKPLLAPSIREIPLLQALFSNTVTITGIKTPSCAVNVIADEISATLDCRLLPGEKGDKFIKILEKAFDNTPVEVTILSRPPDASYSKPDRFFTLLKEAITDTEPNAAVLPILFPASTDNNYFRNKGAITYGFCGTFLRRDLLESVHNFNERLPIEQLVKASAIYKRFLEKTLTLEKP